MSVYDGKRVMLIVSVNGRCVFMQGAASVKGDAKEDGGAVEIRIDQPSYSTIGKPRFLVGKNEFEKLTRKDDEYGCDYIMEIKHDELKEYQDS